MTLRHLVHSRLRDESGIALPMVLLVFILSVALMSAFMISIVGASNVTAQNKGMVAAQAAAEAGIAHVESRLDADDLCGALSTTFSGSSPDYSATVEFGSEGAWLSSCPSSGPTEMRILSEGTSGDLTTMLERRYAIDVHLTPSESPSNVLRTAEGLTLAGNAHIQTTDAAHPADVYVETGNLNCGASGRIEGSVYVAEGTATVSGACPIWGDLVARGDVIFTGSGRVDGTVVSLEGDVRIEGGAAIGGDVFAHRHINRTNGLIVGSMYAGGNISVSGGAPAAQGTATYGGTISYGWGSAATWFNGATPTQGSIEDIPRPSLPATPPWTDVTLTDILANGYSEQAWNGSCTVSGGTPHAYFQTTIPSYTSKTVINALHCNPLRTQSGVDLVLNTDIVIVAPRVQLNNVRIQSGDGQPHRLWVVVPSDLACPGGSNPAILLENTVRFPDPHITALAYTKCTVQLNNAGNDLWPGSIYAKRFVGYSALNYTPIGLPVEMDPSGGGGGSGSAEVQRGALLVQRNIN